MSHGEIMKPMKVVQVGPDAVGADTLRSLLARPDIPYELEAVATVNSDPRHKKLADTPWKGPSELDDVPVIGVVDAIEHTKARVVFSSLEPKLVSRYEERLAADRLVITNASVGRDRPEVAIAGAFVNPDHIDELYGRQDLDGRVIDTGGSLAAIIAVPLAPLDRKIGIESMTVSSMQGWSDRGMTTVPQLAAETQESDTYAIKDEGKVEALRSDVQHLLGDSVQQPSGLHIPSVGLRHGRWVRGHHARVTLQLARPTTHKEVEELWREFEIPSELDSARPQIRSITKAFDGKRWPGRHHSSPVKSEHGSLLHDHSPGLHSVQPLRVAVHFVEIDPEDPRKLTFEIAGDNLVQGLAGGSLLIADYARAQGYLD